MLKRPNRIIVFFFRWIKSRETLNNFNTFGSFGDYLHTAGLQIQCLYRPSTSRCSGCCFLTVMGHRCGRVGAATIVRQSFEEPKYAPGEHENPRQRCTAERNFTDVVFDVPLSVRSGGKVERITSLQATRYSRGIFDDDTTFNYIDCLVDVIKPVESASRTIPEKRSCSSVRAAGENIITSDGISFENPVWMDRRWVQGNLCSTQFDDSFNVTSPFEHRKSA